MLTFKTKAQIVYVDIDPDTTIIMPHGSGEPYYYTDTASYFRLDLFEDGSLDFRFSARRYFYENHVGQILYLNRLTDAYVAGACRSGGFREDIYINDTIDSKLNWDILKYLYISPSAQLFICDAPIGDIYLGLQLIKNQDTVYGWVRCSCSALYNTITIKDYAYNTISGMPILAGQTTTGTATMPPDNISIYENNGMLIMTFSERDLPHGRFCIFNYLGSLVKTGHIKGNYNSISLAGLSSGVYIIQVETKDKVFNKLMYIQAY